MATYTDRIEAMRAIEDAIDAAGYEARTWASDDRRIARVYVKHVEQLGRGKGRKVTDCGFVELRDGIDYSHLTRRSGTLEGLCDGIVFVPAAEAVKVTSTIRVHDNDLDQLEAEAEKGLATESERFG